MPEYVLPIWLKSEVFYMYATADTALEHWDSMR